MFKFIVNHKYKTYLYKLKCHITFNKKKTTILKAFLSTVYISYESALHLCIRSINMRKNALQCIYILFSSKVNVNEPYYTSFSAGSYLQVRTHLYRPSSRAMVFAGRKPIRLYQGDDVYGVWHFTRPQIDGIA